MAITLLFNSVEVRAYNLKKEKDNSISMEIGLKESIVFALKNNLDINIIAISPKIEQENIIKAKSEFDPELNLSVSTGKDKLENNLSAYNSEYNRARSNEVTAGVSGKLYTGTEYNLDVSTENEWSNPNIRRINSSYDSQAGVTLTQPLLKGFGIDINKSDIIIAGRDKKIAEYDFIKVVIDTAALVEGLYWEFVYEQQVIEIKKTLLKQAEDLFRINKKRMDKGLTSNTDVLESELSVLKRKKELLDSYNISADVKDRLKKELNIEEILSVDGINIIPVDPLEYNKININLNTSVKQALEKRPDYLQIKQELLNKDILIKVAKNSMLPELDLQGTFALNGLADDWNSSYNDLKNADTYNWDVSLVFSLPWGIREAKADYEVEKLEKQQYILKLKKKEQDIINDIRSIVRNIKTDIEKIEISKSSVGLEEKILQAETDRFLKGLTTTHDLLEYQVDLSDSKLEYIRSMVNYKQSLVRFSNIKGTVLEDKSLIVE
jgi:outer membrane protein